MVFEPTQRLAGPRAADGDRPGGAGGHVGRAEVHGDRGRDLLELVEDVLLNRRPDASERLKQQLLKNSGGQPLPPVTQSFFGSM